jgi:hypothetical protein
MNPEQPNQLLVEYSAHNGYEPQVQGIAIDLIQERITALTELVQTLVQASPAPQNLILDELTVSIKLDPNGRVLLPADGITLHYRQPFHLPPQPDQGGLDIHKLQQLLNEQKWQEANQETWHLLCRSVQKPEGFPLTTADIHRIPCQTLQVIDQLWKRASQGRFGFGVQRRIYQSQTASN